MCDEPDPLFGDYAQDDSKNDVNVNPRLKVMRRGAGVDIEIIKEIVASNPSNKSWKGIVIAILVILMISGLIILAIYCTSPDANKTNYGSKFTFRDIFLSRNLHKSMTYEWIGKDLLSYVNELNERKLLNLKTKNETDLIWKPYLDEKDASPASCSLSRDGTLMFIYYKHSANYRHSSTAQYTVFDVKKKEVNVEIGPVPQSPLQNAEWSPIGHTLAFVYNNNLYYNENPLDNSTLICVTSNLTQSPQISYGVADWLYEEEILRVSTALWWSPLGENIAFLSFNDENVQNYEIKVYGEQDELNGHFINVRYPKAGSVPKAQNPIVKPYVYNLNSKRYYAISVPREIPNEHVDDDFENFLKSMNFQKFSKCTQRFWNTQNSEILTNNNSNDDIL